MSDDLRNATETVKLRSPIEEVVRERVPALKPQGRLWVACCPFHEERTPSFKVDPSRGTWRCYGACGDGGDQISFVMRFDRVGFREALTTLAARCGVELPEVKRRAREDDRFRRHYEVLNRAEAHFTRALKGRGGELAREYMAGRGLEEATLDAFGIGWSADEYQDLCGRAGEAGITVPELEAVGLARTRDDGRSYDFFRGRLMIPIRDLRGRTLGFGARRLLDGDAKVPKYVNTPETPVFHKGRLIYGLDRAMDSVRRGGHIVLVEGYTDVMAAHQVGMPHVVAVLGTSTTEDHAALLRRAGTRRASLVFDGDEAGRKATVRALGGLLPLDIEIDVIQPPEGRDPCDLLIQDGAPALQSRLDEATPWLEFLLQGLDGQRGASLARGVDEILALFVRIRRPILREDCLREVALQLGYPETSVREQFESLPERRRERSRRENEQRQAAGERRPPMEIPGSGVRPALPSGSGGNGSRLDGDPGRQLAAEGAGGPGAVDSRGPGPGSDPSGGSEGGPGGGSEPGAPTDSPANPRVPQTPLERACRRAYGELAGAVMHDPSLAARLAPMAESCEWPRVGEVLRVLVELDASSGSPNPGDRAHSAGGASLDPGSLMTALGDHPARDIVVPIFEHAAQAENPQALFQGASDFLERALGQSALRRSMEGLAQDPAPEEERETMRELYAQLRRLKITGAGNPAAGSPGVDPQGPDGPPVEDSDLEPSDAGFFDAKS